jgi:hypothetical protein
MGVSGMRRKKLVLGGIAAFLVIVGIASGLLWALLRVPDFYAEAATTIPQEPEQRKLAAKQLVQETTNLINDIQHSDEWSATFKQTQVNSWFLEELRQPKYKDVVPEGVSNPRLVIHEGYLQLGFRFQRNGWNGIVSLQLKPWIEEENHLAIEIESIRAGIVPIPLEDVLHQLAQKLVDEGWEVKWSHSNGHDVAIINLNKNRDPNSPKLQSLTVAEGEVRIQGHSKGYTPSPGQTHNAPKTAANR